ARLVRGQSVGVVGAGNSAGQAVVFLAPHVETLHLIVRGAGLETSMSQYLVERIGSLENVVLHAQTEVVALLGDRSRGVEAATLRGRTDGRTTRLPVRHLFLFIGGEPNTGWLGDVAVDRHGFVVTGREAVGLGASRHAALPL